MNDSDEQHTRRVRVESVLHSIERALRNALSDVNYAQDLIRRENGHPTERGGGHSEALQRLLQSIEGNLMDTVVGIRIINNQFGANASPARPPDTDVTENERE